MNSPEQRRTDSSPLAGLGRARSFWEAGIEGALVFSAGLSILVAAGILFVLSFETISFFGEVSFSQYFLDTQWTPLFADKHFGIWPLLSGTLLTAGIAIGVALPFGLLAAVFLSEFASPRTRSIVKPALEVLAGVPTIVYGYFALVFLTPVLQKVVPGLGGFNALSPGIIMGIMIIPMISSLSEDALASVPQTLREGAWALGAGRLPTIFRVVLPTARSGIAAALTLAIARAIGETMIVAVAAGQQARLTGDPRDPVQTMTAFIVQVSLGDTPTGTIEYKTIFVVGATLFLVTFGMNIISHRLIRKTVVSR